MKTLKTVWSWSCSIAWRNIVEWNRAFLVVMHRTGFWPWVVFLICWPLQLKSTWFVNKMWLCFLTVSLHLSFRFLRCSPFDEYKLWKAQVDNGSKRGRERLNLLTRSLLLRRTKDQLDSTGKPLVGMHTHLGWQHYIEDIHDEGHQEHVQLVCSDKKIWLFAI